MRNLTTKVNLKKKNTLLVLEVGLQRTAESLGISNEFALLVFKIGFLWSSWKLARYSTDAVQEIFDRTCDFSAKEVEIFSN